MKKVCLMLVLTVIITGLCHSQDIINLKNDESIKAKITEVGQTEIRYRKFDNQGGPVYVVAKSEVVKIVYENGSTDVFNPRQAPSDAGVTSAGPVDSAVNRTPAAGEQAKKQSRFIIGFSGVYPTGTWPATALTNMGTTSFLKGQGHTVRNYGFGFIIQMNVMKNAYVFLDGNIYDYNILIGKQGSDVQSTWTVEESATHWDEPGAPQIQYVHNLPTDVYFDMQATGFRLGAKYVFTNKNIRPWLGAGFGFYEWEANYCTREKDKTYGKDRGYATGVSVLGGIDFEPFVGTVFTLFADLGSPVAKYHIEGLFYDQWDIDYSGHIMGTSRFGLTISFAPVMKQKRMR